jgi:hypothetical protein
VLFITPNIFILAAGSSRRFNGAIKQLLPINGEPIIRRTIRQVREHIPDAAIWVVTWHEELMFLRFQVNIIHTGFQPPQLAHSILWTESQWGPRNIILLGDVVYGDLAMRRILDYSGALAVFGSDHCPIKGNERFALSFPGEEADQVYELLAKSASLYENTDLEDHGGLCKICLATMPHWKRILCTISPVHPLFRPARDYFIWHILGGPQWHPDTFHTILIDDGMTTDIDTPEDYAAFLRMTAAPLV